jgi:hypothetical protein
MENEWNFISENIFKSAMKLPVLIAAILFNSMAYAQIDKTFEHAFKRAKQRLDKSVKTHFPNEDSVSYFFIYSVISDVQNIEELMHHGFQYKYYRTNIWHGRRKELFIEAYVKDKSGDVIGHWEADYLICRPSPYYTETEWKQLSDFSNASNFAVRLDGVDLKVYFNVKDNTLKEAVVWSNDAMQIFSIHEFLDCCTAKYVRRE